MKQNLIILPKTRSSIEDRVNRILKDLGNPEPPIDLGDVRELLDLDLAYYQSNDEGLLQEVAHRLRVAGKQVLRKPSRILDAVKKFDLRALYIPEHKKILIDETFPKLKHRWLEAHEIGHRVIPWHEACMHGDQEYIIRPEAHPRLEAEANHAAGRLLFLGDKFISDANDCPISIETIKLLQKRFGNTLSTTLWRFVEQTHSETPLFGVIGSHPSPFFKPSEPKEIIRYFIESPAFHLRFPLVDIRQIEMALSNNSRPIRGGIVAEGEVIILDVDGGRHLFQFQSFFNSYDALTLGYYVNALTLS